MITAPRYRLFAYLAICKGWLSTRLRHHHYLLFGIGGGLLIAQLVLLNINAAQPGRPIIGLRLHHNGVTGQSQTHLNHTIEYLVRSIETKPIIVHAADYTGHVSPRQLGVTYDRTSLRQQVLRVGRSGSIWHRVQAQDTALFGQQNLNLGFARSDKTLTIHYLAALNKQIRKPPQDAHFSYANGKLRLASHVNGVALDTTNSLIMLRSVSDSGLDLTLPTEHLQSKVTTQDLQPLLPEVQKIVAKPLIIAANDKQVSIPPEQIIELIDPIKQPDPQQPSRQKTVISYNDVKLSQKVDQLAAQVTVSPKPTVVNGKYVVSQGTPGVHVDGTHAKIEVIASLEKRSQATASSPVIADNVVIPTEAVNPPITSQFSIDANPLGRYPAMLGNNKMVYLTFDDGPGGYTEDVLNTLKRYNVHAIFFVVGRNVTVYPQTTKRIVSEGHTLGNHSYTHSDLAAFNNSSVVLGELTKTQTAVQSVAGVSPDLFRPPYGSINSTVRGISTSSGLSLMMWTVDPRDWSKPGATVIAQRVIDSVQPGSNVLLHSIHLQTSQALPAIIEGIRAKGFTLP